MVSTRGHPRAFPEPTTATSTPSTSLRRGRPSTNGSAASPTPPSTTVARARSASSASTGQWSHMVSNVTVPWFIVSLTLVIWDTGYIMFRPHTLPGGSMHWPIWVPYELYGKIDGVYSVAAWENKNGFTGAQGLMNIVETSMYFYYLWIVYAYGREVKVKGRGAQKKSAMPAFLQTLFQPRSVGGPEAGQAVVLLFAALVMTLSKTMLYWLLQYCSDYADIGHNTAYDLIVYWIIPNGAWLVVPAYLIYVSAEEMLQGLQVASKKRS